MKTHYASVEEWQAAARAMFGEDAWGWKFVCPSCGHVASVQDWKDAGASEGEVAFACVGRHQVNPAPKSLGQRPGPCDYTGGGLIRLNPVSIEGHPENLFQFAEGSHDGSSDAASASEHGASAQDS